MISSKKFILDLNDDIIIKIFKQIKFNFRLINNQCKNICDSNIPNELPKDTFIFESLSISKYGLLNGYKITNNTFLIGYKRR